jgi:cytosine/adenosine deaminase-related metal-dependent hydrolase
VNGHRSLGWTDAGSILAGYRADLVTVSLRSTRTAGSTPETALETAIFAATAGDVTDVIIDGIPIVTDRSHSTIDVAAELEGAITELLDT